MYSIVLARLHIRTGGLGAKLPTLRVTVRCDPRQLLIDVFGKVVFDATGFCKYHRMYQTVALC